MLNLRHYQEEAVSSLFRYFSTNYGNPIVALPTGTGKALVQAEFIRRALSYYPQTRVLNITHVKELVSQNHAEMLEQWSTAPAGIFSAGLRRRDTHLPITFCGIASVRSYLDYFGHIDLIIVDECHMISDRAASMYAQAISELRTINPLIKTVGLTATPYRLGTGMLTDGKLFTDICCDWTGLDKFNQLVDEGFISPLIPKRTQTELDVTGVGISHGEFNIDELQASVDKDAITRAALTEAYQLGYDRKHWLVFCTGTKHADHARDILNQMGISAACVHSDLPGGDAERDRNITWFKTGMVKAMVGVGVFTTGFNFKPIDLIVYLRPTMSASLWVQSLGRGTRPSPETGKVNCLVLDFAANTRRLGPINDPVIPKKKGKKVLACVPYKICPSCNTYCHTRVRFCPCCKYEFPETFAATINAATDELIRKEKLPKPPKPQKAIEATTLEEFNVQRVEFAKHWSKAQGKPPSLRVTFYCGSRTFNEWFCLEHPDKSFARRRGCQQWELMSSGMLPAPNTIDDALIVVDELQPPVRIRVLTQGDNWPEVVAYEFANGAGEMSPPAFAADDGDTSGPYGVPPGKTLAEAISDDDIPF